MKLRRCGNKKCLNFRLAKAFYHTSATDGRDGRAQADDGSIGFDLVLFQNESGKSGTNPEQLFTMGYATCFDSVMNHVAPLLSFKALSFLAPKYNSLLFSRLFH